MKYRFIVISLMSTAIIVISVAALLCDAVTESTEQAINTQVSRNTLYASNHLSAVFIQPAA
jgi:hypothetical protein